MRPISSSARTDPPSPPPRSPRLYFIRHGETDWNVEGRLQGQRDTPLNARGRLQAQRCGEILGELLARDGLSTDGFDYLASPLVRAAETMRIVRRALGLPTDGFVIDARLKELSFGRWEGLTIPELRVDNAAAVAERERDKWGFVPPEGESYEMLSRRMACWYRGIAHPCIVVAHGGTARALIALLEIAPPRKAPNIDIGQGAVYMLSHGEMTCYQ